jgi:O-acetyl-ADP-ribose deacetylase (regulator of RNase III)
LQTDVIVNTVGSDLNLTKNPCSKAILDEAGSVITSYCEKWIRDHGQVQEGKFAITDGGMLKCKKVLHVSCPSWTADHGEKVTGNVRCCLLRVILVVWRC